MIQPPLTSNNHGFRYLGINKVDSFSLTACLGWFVSTNVMMLMARDAFHCLLATPECSSPVNHCAPFMAFIVILASQGVFFSLAVAVLPGSRRAIYNGLQTGFPYKELS